jgi:hypothetical protein
MLSSGATPQQKHCGYSAGDSDDGISYAEINVTRTGLAAGQKTIQAKCGN